VSFGLRVIAHLEIESGQAIVARKEKLRLTDLLGDCERLLVLGECLLRLTVTLINLPQNDQRNGQVIKLTQAPIELDRRLGGIDPLGIAAVGHDAVGEGQIRVEPRLKTKVADLLRDFQPALARLDCAARIDGAVEGAQVGVAPTGSLQEAVGCGDCSAAFDVSNGLFRPLQPSESHSKRVVSLGEGRHYLSLVSALAGRRRQFLGVSECPFRPLDRPGVVAHSKGHPTHLLI